MMQIGANPSTTYHNPGSVGTPGGQAARSSSVTRQQVSQYDDDQLANIRPRLCTLRKWPHYDGYGVHLARNQHWLGLRIGDVEPNSPAESGGLLREDVVLAVNGHSVENDDFFVILSFIQHELEDDQIRFLVLDPQSVELAHRHQIAIDESFPTCVRMETPALTVSPEQILYQQWRNTSQNDPISSQNTINLGRPTAASVVSPSTVNERRSVSSTRENVFTFPSYSDRAIENGKSLLEILFDQDTAVKTAPEPTTQKRKSKIGITSLFAKKTTDAEQSINHRSDDEKQEKKHTISEIRDGVKSFVVSSIDNIKAALPSRNTNDTHKDNSNIPSLKDGDIDGENSKTPSSPSFLSKLKKKLRPRSSSSSSVEDKNERDQQASNEQQPVGLKNEDDGNKSSQQEPRLCTVKLRPGWDIGISIQPDDDCGHIITRVDHESPAARAGIERDDCIISLNETPLLNLPYDEVLSIIQNSRHYLDLDFLVAKKPYLLTSWQSHVSTNPNFHEAVYSYGDSSPKTTFEVLPSSNISTSNNLPSNVANDTLEKLYNKYVNEKPSNLDQSHGTVPTKTSHEQERRMPTSKEADQYSTKQQGKIVQGVGPVTAENESWGVNNEKSIDRLPPIVSADGSIRSTSRTSRTDAKDTKLRDSYIEDSFKPLQVGITNPSAAQQSSGTSPTLSREQRAEQKHTVTALSTPLENQDAAQRHLASPDTERKSSDGDVRVSSAKPSAAIEKVQETSPLTPIIPISVTVVGTSQPVPQKRSPSPESPLVLDPIRQNNTLYTPIKTATPVAYYGNTDDESLSDISENSQEDEVSDIGQKRNDPSQLNNTFNEKQNPSNSSIMRENPAINIITPSSDTNSSSSDIHTPEAISEVPESSRELRHTREVTRAKRLEESDSDETTSEITSQTNENARNDRSHSSGASTDDEDEESDAQVPKESITKSFQSAPSDNSSEVLGQLINKRSSDAELTTEQSLVRDSIPATGAASTDHTPFEAVRNGLNSSLSLAKIPITELKDHGYELHNIQLMQPTEQNPVGLKLTKQQQPLQFIITAIAKGTKADLAGLKVNDWLIKVEEEDVRSIEFTQVSQRIRQLLTDSGMINMVIARKRSSTESSPALVKSEQPKVVEHYPAESIGRAQGNSMATSILTTDITRDTPNNEQVRFVPEPQTSSTSPSSRVQPTSRENKTIGSSAPLAIGLTNPISDETQPRSRQSTSQSPTRSPTREYTVAETKPSIVHQDSSDIDPKDIRRIVMKEALGLDFNSFIPDGDSQTQTHFISNVQPNSMADKAGLRDGDRILTVNGIDVTNAIHEDVRQMMQSQKPLQLTVFNDPKYLELIENVRRSKKRAEEGRDETSPSPPDYETITNVAADQSNNLNNRSRSTARVSIPVPDSEKQDRQRSPDSAKAIEDQGTFDQRTLFVDSYGEVQVKHCVLRKAQDYNGYGLLLRYQNGVHLIDQVESASPAYNSGLREHDVILYVDGENAEKMTHDDVKSLIRKLSAANAPIDLILLKKQNVSRYNAYKEYNQIDPIRLFQDSTKSETSTKSEPQQTIESPRATQETATERKPSFSSSQKQTAPIAPSTVSPSLPDGSRICILETKPNTQAGFALSGKTSAPYLICSIDENSPAFRAGLKLNDAILSINEKSVIASSYEEVVRLVREALQHKTVKFIVKNRSAIEGDGKLDTNDQHRMGSHLSANTNTNSTTARDSDVSYQGGVRSSNGDHDSSYGANPVEEYQKQRNKELSYTLRLCHLHPANSDGSQSVTFGFELSEDPDFDYPLILRVEPQSPAEVAGLQSRDILIRVNDRKTKGLGYEKVRKEIEKAKRDGRLEMLVADQETFNYCKRMKKPLKEPEIKIKHIFPKSRSSASFHKLPGGTSNTLLSSHDSTESHDNIDEKERVDRPYFHAPISNESTTDKVHQMGSSQETDSDNNDENTQQLSSTSKSHNEPNTFTQIVVGPETSSSPARSHPSTSSSMFAPASAPPSQNPDNHISSSGQRSTSSMTGSNISNQSPSASAAIQSSSDRSSSNKDSKGSKSKGLPNAINNLFHKIGHHSKSSKLDNSVSQKSNNNRSSVPSPPSSRILKNSLNIPRISQSVDTINTIETHNPIVPIHNTVRSTISTGSFDYLQGPRRCILRVDRNKGFGFVLSATGDFDHTITEIEKLSAADIAGLKVNDEILEVDGIDVRRVKYEEVVNMLVSAMRKNELIELLVIDRASRYAYMMVSETEKISQTNGEINSNNNNNTTATATVSATIDSQRTTAISGEDLSDMNSLASPFDTINQQKLALSYPSLTGEFQRLEQMSDRALSGSVPTLATGITASPLTGHSSKNLSSSSERGSTAKIKEIASHEAPVARLCRIRRFPTSLFYGFFLRGDPKKLGRVFVSDVTKNSPAAVCGLRDGDRIIEINGSPIDSMTYETILDKIKQHMALDDLELLVLDKKSVNWYRDRQYPITSRTLPTIIHIETIINDSSNDSQSSEVPPTNTKPVGFRDRRLSKTGL